MKTVTITFVNPVGVIGGAERVLLAVIQSVRHHFPGAHLRLILFADGPLRSEAEHLGAEVSIIALPDRLARLGDSQYRDQARLVALVRTGWSGLRGLPAMIRCLGQLRSEVRRQSPHLIHSNGLKAHALLALVRPKRVPILWHLHDFLTDRPAMTQILRHLGRDVAGVLAISPAVGRDARVVLPGLPVTVIPNAVDTTRFAPADRDGSALDQMAGLDPAGPEIVRIGLVATYARWKGHEIFLAALARLVAEVPTVRGFLIGGPIYSTAGSQFSRGELESRVADLGLTGRVGLIPFLADPVDAYRMLDVVVHASTQPEPFGLTIVEAMACGRPVVVAADGGAAEVVTPGHDGLHHVPGNANDLARAIARVVADPDLRDRLGSYARQTAVTQYDQKRFSAQIADLYTSLMKVGRLQ